VRAVPAGLDPALCFPSTHVLGYNRSAPAALARGQFPFACGAGCGQLSKPAALCGMASKPDGIPRILIPYPWRWIEH